jgi:hypothetical protein
MKRLGSSSPSSKGDLCAWAESAVVAEVEPIARTAALTADAAANSLLPLKVV